MARVMLCFCSDIFSLVLLHCILCRTRPFRTLALDIIRPKIQTKFLDHLLIHVLV
ncbi:hypothetical protein GQ55_9G277900 [Panicum hallii var. hallii]|uniref:Uncharacterized protein n=1 Tax=Panicum hallii var. hallii TaxID=1504633 RepID=A0A2T7C7G3_9POAL|nr:hypothetical protein GQ55_9G277900 [Panicum hallii var. hallii]